MPLVSRGRTGRDSGLPVCATLHCHLRTGGKDSERRPVPARGHRHPGTSKRATPPSSGGHQLEHSPDEFFEGAATVDEPIPKSSTPFSSVPGNDGCSIAQEVLRRRSSSSTRLILIYSPMGRMNTRKLVESRDV
jgi:hypothetical protein